MDCCQFYLATRPVDFRKGHDGLSALVQEMFGLNPFSGAIFSSCSGW
ncbi:MAG: IS66 family insertion sequence element accessory protein TnpB [Methylocella sp.]